MNTPSLIFLLKVVHTWLGWYIFYYSTDTYVCPFINIIGLNKFLSKSVDIQRYISYSPYIVT